MMPRYIVGMDPGIHGAVAIFRDQKLWLVEDMPTIKRRHTMTGKEFTVVNAPALGNYLRSHIDDDAHIYFERVRAHAMAGKPQSFSFGHSAGIIEGVAAGLLIPYSFVMPQHWQAYWKLIGKGKDDARELALELFPHHGLSFRLKKHDGRADAALVGAWAINIGWELEHG